MTEPSVNEDFVDIVSSFNEEGVVFLVVGAYALAAHGFPRTITERSRSHDAREQVGLVSGA